jgi:hypothetical protein
MIADLNPYIRGARHYFRRIRRRTLSNLDGFVNQRLARWWASQHGHRRPAWSLVHQDALRRHHGLERWNLPAAPVQFDARGGETGGWSSRRERQQETSLVIGAAGPVRHRAPPRLYQG